jgi:uncharacterized protein (DUF952 family)
MQFTFFKQYPQLSSTLHLKQVPNKRTSIVPIMTRYIAHLVHAPDFPISLATLHRDFQSLHRDFHSATPHNATQFPHHALTGSYQPPTLKSQQESFVHCSSLGQTLATANRFFHHVQADRLYVLLIDTLALPPAQVQLVWEGPIAPPGTVDAVAPDLMFPHLYGAGIPYAAIVNVLPVRRNEVGLETLPWIAIPGMEVYDQDNRATG